jgi:molecular chaperone GrpE
MTPAEGSEDINGLAAETASGTETNAKAGTQDYQKKAADYYDQLLRLQAEFINFRKRAEREKTDAIRYGRDTMVERMISLLDVMDQALHHAEKSTDTASLKQGFNMVVSEFHRLLKAEGLETLPSVGSPFDPHVHEAVEKVSTEKDEENGIVLEELQKGYKLNGKLFRPARVKVGESKKQ